MCIRDRVGALSSGKLRSIRISSNVIPSPSKDVYKRQQFQGWIDTLHGGTQAVLLDEICAWVILRDVYKRQVILMTAWGSIQLAVQGMQAGAFDFITKPWNNVALMQRLSLIHIFPVQSGRFCLCFAVLFVNEPAQCRYSGMVCFPKTHCCFFK